MVGTKTVILAGGFGSRLSEETARVPKPMVEIGGHPILWHIMMIYGAHGIRDFLIACGYKGSIIKDYFDRFVTMNTDWRINLRSGTKKPLSDAVPDWDVAVVDTGENVLTGGRIGRLRSWLKTDRFMLTYGDGVGDLNISALMEFHRSHGKLATLTAVHPAARFGALELEGNRVRVFSEKDQLREGWINGGFFVFEPGVLDFTTGDDVSLETDVLPQLCEQGELMAFKHSGFWHPMDTLRDCRYLQQLWDTGEPPWKIWQR